MYAPLSRVLIRAPLLPARALPHAARALAAHPLGADAIALASPSLAAARPDAARARAIERYARRAAFRPTPSGLLAGVCVGTLGTRADVATGAPVAWLAPSWARIAAAARALLDDPAVQDRVRLRVAPSLLRAPEIAWWIGPGDPFGQASEVELNERLEAVLDGAAEWTPWPVLRTAALPHGDEAHVADHLLLDLIDFGLLHTDLRPPLVGPPPHLFLAGRLAAIGLDAERAELEAAVLALAAGDLEAGSSALARLPGAAARPVQAVLVHVPPRPPRIPRAPVERAARLIPLLLRLQEALAPPAGERLASPALADALDACTEIYGAGAFDLDALTTDEYGVSLGDDDDGPTGASPDVRVVALLAEALAGAAARGTTEVALDAAALDQLLAEPTAASLPETAELFLVPTALRAGARAGDGWLLGLHGPAGSSLGRFVHALGPAMAQALAEIAAAEREAGAGERLDVDFAPSAELADLCAHPPVRPRALAISGWPAGASVTLADLALVADPARPEALSLRPRGETAAVVPSPLARVRSATAPVGTPRLALGWTLQRQHAPWAFTPGPLEALDRHPRVTLDGFVIAPASWRVPPDLREGRATRAALGRWRRAARVPRHVQVGEGDELLPVDLNAPSALRELAGVGRVHEIWPPQNATIDRDGRRVEVVVPVVRAEGARVTVPDLARVPPPREAPPLGGWRTFKLFGPVERQDQLLLHGLRPLLDKARAASEIDAWFFLRYVDGPGRRAHLRLRTRGGGRPIQDFEGRLREALGKARTSGAVTSLETAEYFPERGRFRGDELIGLHEIFQADSEAVLGLLEENEHAAVQRARLFDAIAGGFGLDPAAREGVATGRRTAADRSTDSGPDERREADAEFRNEGRTLRALLSGERSEPLQRLAERVAGAVLPWAAQRRDVLLPTLLHLSSVRFGGADPDGERLGYTFWQRALEGLRRAPR